MEQPEYNMLARDRVDKDYVLLYEHYGTGLTIFSPLKLGILTGKYNDGIPEDSRFNTSEVFKKGAAERVQTEEFKAAVQKVRKLAPIAEKLGCDQAALAMAWVLKNPNVSSAITGASRVEQIGKSVKSLAIVPKLTPEIMDEIDEILANKPAALTRRF